MSAPLPFRVVTLAVVALLGLSACGADGSDVDGADDTTDSAAESTAEPTAGDQADDDESASTVAPNGEEVEVLAVDNNFRPEEIEIVAGTAVRWENGGRNDHNILPGDDTDDWGVDVADFAPGDVYTRVFTVAGEYPYYCSLHGTADFGMFGTVVVTG